MKLYNDKGACIEVNCEFQADWLRVHGWKDEKPVVKEKVIKPKGEK